MSRPQPIIGQRRFFHANQPLHAAGIQAVKFMPPIRSSLFSIRLPASRSWAVAIVSAWLATQALDAFAQSPLPTTNATPANSSIAASPPSIRSEPPSVWLASYGDAWKVAEERRSLLLLQLWKPADRQAAERWRLEMSQVPPLRGLLANCVLGHCDADQPATAAERQAIGRHPAFAELQGRSGLAIVDLQAPQRATYGRVISLVPATGFSVTGFSATGSNSAGSGAESRFPSASALRVLLELPAGSLTQRTLIYAVRLHPESPRSTDGHSHPLLFEEAEKHSSHQASIGVQGHHAWDQRFHRINARLPAGVIAQEVCAESWPGQDLVAAAVECVHSWRQSSGHWSAVSGRHAYFGYDMKRGANGIWYATGIFGRSRGS